ncbi:CYP26A [Mytilus coruscus]|uniref:CYP26A n=1 Tax=Mytilus coruscus TaxID=42192 RepID=A0A6J8AEH9_MYTCO|nr:CYP26A [Mytilus coruscus]
MIDLISILIIVVLLIVDYFRKDKKTEHTWQSLESKLPPGGNGIPVIGETFQFLLKKGQFFKEKAAIYGQIYRTHLFGKPTVRVTGKENVRKILYGENKIVRSSYPSSVRKLVGCNGLTFSSGLVHDNRKKHLMQFLRTDFVNQHVSGLSEFVRGRLQNWCNHSSINLYVETKTLITEIAAKFLISSDIDKSMTERLVPLYEDFTGNLFTIPINIPGFGFHKALNAKEKLKALFKEALLSNKDRSLGRFPAVLEAYGASLDNNTFDEDAFLDGVLELLWNASETTSSSVFCSVYLLTKHPDVVRRIKEELVENEITSDATESLNHKQLQSLKYVDTVVKELLRVVPPIGGAYREVIEEFSVGGYTIPKDWTVICGIRETQENDKSSEDPLCFNPDRWNEKSSSNIAFYTFGGGKRICPGQSFAKQVLKLFIVELVRNVEWTIFNEDCELIYFPTPQPKHIMNASFHMRRQFDKL